MKACCLLFLSFVLWLFVHTGMAQSREVLALSLGQGLEKPIAGSETHDFSVDAAAGEAVLITVEQRDADVAVSVLDPAHKDEKLNETDFSYGVFGTEELFFVAPQKGTFLVRVASVDNTAKPGAYRIQLVSRRPASEKDRQEFLAEQTFQEGGHARLEATADSYKRAVAKYDEAARIWTRIGNDRGVAFAAYYKTVVYFTVGDQRSALAAVEVAIPLFHKIGNRHMEGAVLNHAGVLANALGERQKAIGFYEQALSVARELKNTEVEGLALSNLASVYALYGDQRRALGLYEQALPLRATTSDKAGLASTLNNIGAAYVTLGEPIKAAQYYRESLSISMATKNFNSATTTLGNLSDLARDAGETDKAFEYLNEAIDVAGRVGNRFETAARLVQQTNLYRFVGDQERALDSQRRAFAMATETGNRDAALNSLVSLGRIEYEQSDFEKSRESYLRALELAKSLNSEISIATLLDSIGMTLLAAGRPDDAFGYFSQAKTLWGKTGYKFGTAENYYNLALANRRKGDAAAALENLRQSISIAEQIQAVRLQAWAHYEIAGIQAAQNDLPAALQSIERAVRLSESIRAGISRDDFRTKYFSINRRFYELYIEILLRLGESRKDPGMIGRALEASEQSRARTLVELLSRSAATLKTDPRLLQRERENNARLSAKAELQTRLLASGKAQPGELAAVARELSDLMNEREKLAAEIRQTNSNYAALMQPAPVKAKEIQALLDKDTVFLEYSLGDAQSQLWLVTGDAITVHKLPRRDEIERVAREFYESLKTNGETSRRSGNALSELLLAPVADKLAGKRIVVVAEGVLQYVSFAALPNPKAKDQYLIQTNEVVNLPSASTLAVLRPEAANRKAAPRSVAVFADPVFSGEDPRVKNAAAKPDDHATAVVHRSFEESTEAGEEVMKTIPRLPFSRREADAILQTAGPERSLKAVDFAASTSAAKGGMLSDYRIVHFATHGILNSKNPELSGLVLSLVNEKGEPVNGFLRMSDIYDLKLNADLVVLSACRTALGKDVRGEGLIGLSRGFMYAGSPRVVASLWKVDDAATAELMNRFYTGMLRKDLRPAEALRAAQIEMINDERFGSPYFWAAFTLQGEWK